MDDVTGVLNAATAAVRLVGTVSRLAPGIQNAAHNLNRPKVSQQGELSPQDAIPFDNEQERRAYEQVNMVLRNVGERLVKSGLVDEAALGRALTAVTQHIEVQLFSIDNNKLFQSLANRLGDAQLVTNVFTTIYFIAFLTSELQSSLPNYKSTYIPVGQRMIQQMFKVALGLDAFKDNLAANLEAYKTLATTAGMLKPLDLDVTIFRNFPSFGLSKYSGKSYSDTTYNKKAYSNLVTWFYEKGFPQPLQGRDVGAIRDWTFLAGDTNTRDFEVERADKHIGENFGRVLYWLLCMAHRLNDGAAVIVYHEQHIRLVRWLDDRFGYRVLKAATDLNMIPHSQMKPKHRAIFNSWLIIMPSQTALQKRKDTVAALAAQGMDPVMAAKAAQQVEDPDILRQNSNLPGSSNLPLRVPVNAMSSPPVVSPASHQMPSPQQQQNNTNSIDPGSVMADPILSHIATKQAEQRASDYAPSAPSARDEDVGTVISSESFANNNDKSAISHGHQYGDNISNFNSADDDMYRSGAVGSSVEVARSALPSAMPMGNRTNSGGLAERFKQIGVANMANAQAVPPLPDYHLMQRPQSSINQRPLGTEIAGSPPHPGYPQQPGSATAQAYHSMSQSPTGGAGSSMLNRGNSVSRRPVGSPPLQQPTVGPIAELQDMSATMTGPAELADTYRADMSPTATVQQRQSTMASRRSSGGAASIATTSAPTKARRAAPAPPKIIQAVAKFDFEPDEEDEDGEELAFSAGDLIEIVSKTKALEEDGWCQARIKGTFKTGLAPLEYLEQLPEPKKRAPRAPKAAPAATSQETAVATTQEESVPTTSDLNPELESSRGLNPPPEISEVSADPPEQTRAERMSMVAASSAGVLSPAREPHMQSPPSFLPHPGTSFESGRGRESKDDAPAARDVSPLQSSEPRSPPTLATEDTITPLSYQSPPARSAPLKEDAPPSPVSSYAQPFQPPPGPPPQQAQPAAQQPARTRQASNPQQQASAAHIPSPSQAQVERLRQRQSSAAGHAHMPEPTFRPAGASQNYYHPVEPGLGGNAFTAHTNPRPPSNYVPYNTVPIAVNPSFNPQQTVNNSNALDLGYSNNSVNQNQTQKQNTLDLSGANISLFGDHSVHQEQNMQNNMQNNNDLSYNNDSTDYTVVGSGNAVPVLASPLATLSSGSTTVDYFDQTTITSGVSPLAGLMAPVDSKSPAYVESTTITDTDVYVDAQGDVSVDTTTVTETDVYGDGFSQDNSYYQSYVEDDALDLI